MPHVHRDAAGNIEAIYGEERPGVTEWVPFNDPEVVRFLGCHGQPCPLIPDIRELAQLDMAQIRIIEDLVDLLTQKNVIMFTELPPEAQAKLMNKREARRRLARAAVDLGDDDGVL
jgi:hypothetical protein